MSTDDDHQPIESKQEEIMNKVASVLDAMFQPYGFCLLVFPMNNDDGRMNYICNAERSTMLTAMKELVARFEGRVPKTPGAMQ